MSALRAGADLIVGDVLADWMTSRTITGFEEHPGLKGPLWEGDETEHHAARVARSGGWGITIFDDDRFGQTPYGWAPAHHVHHLRAKAMKALREKGAT